MGGAYYRGLLLVGLIIGRIFSFKILWGLIFGRTYFRGGAYYRKFTVRLCLKFHITFRE